jgi:tetratricopeptide (TPR) repeat protein
MRFGNQLRLACLALLLAGTATVSQAAVQANAPPATDAASRQKALDLFHQDKRLEALPLLEELAKANPEDDTVLVALAACLVEHSSTLGASAAAQERFRARDLLAQAMQLGNTSALAANLAQLLQPLPDSGAIKFSDNAAVQQAMNDGEAAFARRDFDQAIKDYARALELEPGNYMAALFTGNSYDRKNEFPKAGEWYRRAMELSPDTETAYRYNADMLAKEGDMAGARAMLVRAAVAEPYNKIVWRELQAWATINHTAINTVYVGIPPDPRDAQAQATLNPEHIAGVSGAWDAYRAVKAKWQQDDFKRRFPQESTYRHTLAEESEALIAEARVLKKMNEDKKTLELLAKDKSLSLLLRLYENGLIEAYVLFSLGDAGISRDYACYRVKNRARLEEYMEKFVVPAAPAHP